jgi:hypothetical protein
MLILLGIGGLVAVGVIVIIAVILALQFGSTTRGSSTSNANQISAPSSAIEARSTSEMITDTNNQIGVALLNGDTSALSRLLADDYRYVSDAGLTLSKAEVLLLIRSGNLSYESLKSADEKVEVNSDATRAELTARSQSRGQLRHQTFNDTNFYRNTFEKRDGKWQLISETVWHRQ